MPWVSLLFGAVVCTFMIIKLPSSTWVRLVVWTLIGALVYGFYGYRHSKLRTRVAAPTR